MREATLRQRRDLRRQSSDAARQDTPAAAARRRPGRGRCALWHENDALQAIVATIPPLEARLAQTTYELGLIQNSRTWRVREALVNVLGARAAGQFHANSRPSTA